MAGILQVVALLAAYRWWKSPPRGSAQSLSKTIKYEKDKCFNCR